MPSLKIQNIAAVPDMSMSYKHRDLTTPQHKQVEELYNQIKLIGVKRSFVDCETALRDSDFESNAALDLLLSDNFEGWSKNAASKAGRVSQHKVPTHRRYAQDTVVLRLGAEKAGQPETDMSAGPSETLSEKTGNVLQNPPAESAIPAAELSKNKALITIIKDKEERSKSAGDSSKAPTEGILAEGAKVSQINKRPQKRTDLKASILSKAADEAQLAGGAPSVPPSQAIPAPLAMPAPAPSNIPAMPIGLPQQPFPQSMPAMYPQQMSPMVYQGMPQQIPMVPMVPIQGLQHPAMPQPNQAAGQPVVYQYAYPVMPTGMPFPQVQGQPMASSEYPVPMMVYYTQPPNGQPIMAGFMPVQPPVTEAK